jgi:hypothetical protein
MDFHPGIVDDPKVPEVLRRIESSSIPGAKKLLNKFLQSGSKKDSDPAKGYDFWLEIFIMWKLMNDNRISNLVYEPIEYSDPPDFRFNIDTIRYDLEVKYIRPYEERRLFKVKCEKYLSNIQKPWDFFYYLRDNKFRKKHISQFISYLKDQINTFQTNTYYYWPPKYDCIVHFWFVENASGNPPISIPMPLTSMWSPDQLVIELRKRIKNKISKTKKKIVNTVGPFQSNILLLQIENVYPMIGDSESVILHRVFYDKDGFSHQENKKNLENTFSCLNGIIILKSCIGLPDHNIEGTFFINPINKEIVKNHPILFSKIVNNQVGQSGEPSCH